MNKLKLKKINKKADLATLALVILTLFLAGCSLFVFIANTNKIETEIVDARVLDFLYVRENEINFYISESIDKSSDKLNNKKSETEFINLLKQEVDNYKINGDFVVSGLSQINKQINSDNVRIKDNQIFLNLSIKIEGTYNEKFIVSYLYDKEFVKDIV